MRSKTGVYIAVKQINIVTGEYGNNTLLRASTGMHNTVPTYICTEMGTTWTKLLFWYLFLGDL
jgi:hypothetical protein